MLGGSPSLNVMGPPMAGPCDDDRGLVHKPLVSLYCVCGCRSAVPVGAYSVAYAACDLAYTDVDMMDSRVDAFDCCDGGWI